MSKQKKEKQSPVLGRLLAYAGGHKWLSVLGCGLSGVSAAAGIFPFVFVWYAARGILTPGGGVPAGLTRYGWYALAAALLSAAIYFAGLMCTHLAAFRVATNMRKAAAAHLIDLPLGYFNANLTGRLRKQIDDNAALTETLLAHTIPDAVGGIVTPILAVGLLFVFDWRMGLACLIPMVIGLVCLMSMMTGRGMKFFGEYQRAGERISAEATEYVRGIPVVKVFQQTVYSFKSFHAAILSYPRTSLCPQRCRCGLFLRPVRDADGNLICLTCADFTDEAEFRRWKRWSDQDFHAEDKSDVEESDHTTSMGMVSEAALAVPNEEALAAERQVREDQIRYAEAAVSGIRSILTGAQFYRLRQYCIEGKTESEIAEAEGVTQQAVSKSLVSALKKRENF